MWRRQASSAPRGGQATAANAPSGGRGPGTSHHHYYHHHHHYYSTTTFRLVVTLLILTVFSLMNIRKHGKLLRELVMRRNDMISFQTPATVVVKPVEDGPASIDEEQEEPPHDDENLKSSSLAHQSEEQQQQRQVSLSSPPDLDEQSHQPGSLAAMQQRRAATTFATTATSMSATNSKDPPPASSAGLKKSTKTASSLRKPRNATKMPPTSLELNGPIRLVFQKDKREKEDAIAYFAFSLGMPDCEQWAVAVSFSDGAASSTELLSSWTVNLPLFQDWCLLVVEGDEESEGPEEGNGASTGETVKEEVTDDSVNGTSSFYLSNEERANFLDNSQSDTSLLSLRAVGYLFVIHHGAQVVWDYDPNDEAPWSPLQRNEYGSVSTFARELHGSTWFAMPEYGTLDPSFYFCRPKSGTERLQGAFPFQYVSVPRSSVGMVVSPSLCGCDENGAAVADSAEASKIKLLLPPHWDLEPFEKETGAPSSVTFPHSGFWTLWFHQQSSSSSSNTAAIVFSVLAQSMVKATDLDVLVAPGICRSDDGDDEKATAVVKRDLMKKSTTETSRQLTKLQNILDEWVKKNKQNEQQNNLLARVELLLMELFERDLVQRQDVIALQQWLAVLNKIGYEFPKLAAHSSKKQYKEEPSLHGQPYLASPAYNLGGLHGNVTYRSLWNNINSAQGYSHHTIIWDDWLSGASVAPPRPRPGTILKLISTATNSIVSMIHFWVSYHGAIVGFENLYVFDGGNSGQTTEFLRYARDNWGVNVIFSPSTAVIKDIDAEVNKLMIQISPACDFIMKLFPDEYLALQKPDSTCSDEVLADAENAEESTATNCEVTPYGLKEYLSRRSSGSERTQDDETDQLPLHELAFNYGGRIAVGHVGAFGPSPALCRAKGSALEGNQEEEGTQPTPTDSLRTLNLQFHSTRKDTTAKIVFDARTVHAIDYRGQYGEYLPPWEEHHHGIKYAPVAHWGKIRTFRQKSPLAIIRGRLLCLEQEIARCWETILTHNYMRASAPPIQQYRRLKNIWIGPDATEEQVCHTRPEELRLQGASHDKVLFYIQYLAKCAHATAEGYYGQQEDETSEGRPNPEFQRFINEVMTHTRGPF